MEACFVSARLRDAVPRRVPMTLLRLDDVLEIERAAYEFPWTRANFIDSLAARYVAEMLVDDGAVLGYFVAMAGIDEMHLLNLTVAPSWQGQGHGRTLLDALAGLCRARSARTLWLEVRESNLRARRIYERYGFAEVGRRRGYYPAARNSREDAIVMSLEVGDVE
jgi:ribosomal-protein-alanine N-acetyltransferase